MNRNEAKKVAEIVSISELEQMFINAQNGIKDWTKVSIVNKCLTKGTAFNILSKCGVSKDTHILAKINMLREFGEWLPNYKKETKKRFVYPNPFHEDPNFINQ